MFSNGAAPKQRFLRSEKEMSKNYEFAAGSCASELQLKVNCRKIFGLVCQLLAKPVQILFYNSLVHMIQALAFVLIVQPLTHTHITYLWQKFAIFSPQCTSEGSSALPWNAVSNWCNNISSNFNLMHFFKV